MLSLKLEVCTSIVVAMHDNNYEMKGPIQTNKIHAYSHD